MEAKGIRDCVWSGWVSEEKRRMMVKLKEQEKEGNRELGIKESTKNKIEKWDGWCGMEEGNKIRKGTE